MAGLFERANEHLLRLAHPHIKAARGNGLRVVGADTPRLRVSTRSHASLTPDHYALALFLPGLVGATLNQFVVQAALEKAEKVIESESTIVLTRRESLRLLEMIDNPPPRTEKFFQAQARYQRLRNDAGSTA